MVAEAKPLGSGRGSVTYKDVVDDLPLSALLMLFGVQKVLRHRMGRRAAGTGTVS